MKTRKIKVGILLDPMGCSGKTMEEEYAEHVTDMTEKLAPHKVRFYQAWHADSTGSKGIQPGTDLVLFDFGGMLPGNNLMESNAQAIIRWCIDNPNSLCLVMSSFTYSRAIDLELKYLGLDKFPNLIDYTYEFEVPKWFYDGAPAPTGDTNENR